MSSGFRERTNSLEIKLSGEPLQYSFGTDASAADGHQGCAADNKEKLSLADIGVVGEAGIFIVNFNYPRLRVCGHVKGIQTERNS